MENPLHSSFIPARPGAATPLGQYTGDTTSRDITDVFVLIGTIAIIIAGTLAGGVFLYKLSVAQGLETTKKQLETAEKSFNPKNVRELSRMDERIRVAESLLKSHIAPSMLFAVLQQTTLQSIQFKSMDFDGASQEKLIVEMKGVATGVNAIALQANIFSRHPAIKDPIFQINDLTKDGVTFDVSFMLNPDIVNYESLILALNAQQRRSQPAVEDGGIEDAGDGFEIPSEVSEQGEGFSEEPESTQGTRRAPPDDGFGNEVIAE